LRHFRYVANIIAKRFSAPQQISSVTLSSLTLAKSPSKPKRTMAHNVSLYVSARDTGPGISAADQGKLFQEFQQADNARRKAAPAWGWLYRSA
jgi:signal transduction histidine kinase